MRIHSHSVVTNLARWSGNKTWPGNKTIEGVDVLKLQALAKQGYGVEVIVKHEMTYDDFVDEVMRLLESS